MYISIRIYGIGKARQVSTSAANAGPLALVLERMALIKSIPQALTLCWVLLKKKKKKGRNPDACMH
jgi:hypothetical protein